MTRKGAKGRKKTFKEVLAEVGSESNVHGISRIVSSKSVKTKVFWILLVILAFTGATIHLTFLVKTYLLYPVAELSSTKEGVSVEFPSVTLCNMNPISMQKLTKLFDTSDIIPWFSFLTNLDEIKSYRTKLESQEAFYENFQHIAPKLGYTADEFILKCTFEGRSCGPANFSLFFESGNYYNCFTFNDGYNKEKRKLNDKKLLATGTGVEHGLSLILSTGIEKFPAGSYGVYDEKNRLQFSAGVRVDIHASGTMPSPSTHGFDVSPGFSTTVGLEALLHDKPAHPHGNCTADNLKLFREYSKTMFSCLQFCKQKILETSCKCRNSGITLKYETDPVDGHILFCSQIKDFKNWTYVSKEKKDSYLKKLTCEDNVLNSFDKNQIDLKKCGCFPPCKEVTYRKSISASYWPIEFYQFDLLRVLQVDRKTGPEQLREAYDILNKTFDKYNTLTMTGLPAEYEESDWNNHMRASAMIRQNLVRLNIYMDSLRITEFKKIPTYGILGLMADIGGTLGLWLGISCITIMELVELKMRLALYLVKSRGTISLKGQNDDLSDVVTKV